MSGLSLNDQYSYLFYSKYIISPPFSFHFYNKLPNILSNTSIILPAIIAEYIEPVNILRQFSLSPAVNVKRDVIRKSQEMLLSGRSLLRSLP
jgi:hypothetical protein